MAGVISIAYHVFVVSDLAREWAEGVPNDVLSFIRRHTVLANVIHIPGIPHKNDHLVRPGADIMYQITDLGGPGGGSTAATSTRVAPYGDAVTGTHALARAG
jgi:hypothetical protein